MSLQDDPRPLQKATVEQLLTLYYKRIYGENEIEKMENKKRSILEKYEKKEELFEKVPTLSESETQPFLEECLQMFCEESLNRTKDHTPETLLMLAQFFIELGDFRLTSEILWECASLALTNFITDRRLNVNLSSDSEKRDFTRALSSDIRLRYSIIDVYHSPFYNYTLTASDVNEGIETAKQLMKLLEEFELSDGKKEELENTRFE